MRFIRRKTWINLWLSFSAAFIALLPQFYLVYSASNRYTMLWSRTYHAAILSAIATLAVLFFAAQRTLKTLATRLGRPFWADAVCMTWMVFLCLRTLSALLVRMESLPEAFSHLLWSPWTKLVLYVALPVPAILLHPAGARRVLRRLFAALSVPFLFFLASSAIWPTFENYHAGLDKTDAARKTAAGRSFLVFILDEWSPSRTFGAPDWRERFPALADLIRQSTWYTRAYSLGGETRVSLPRLLFSNDPGFLRKSYKEVYAFNEKALPPEGPALFDLAPAEWLRLAVGFTLNYPVLLDGRADLALRFESENVRRTFRGEFRHLLLSQFAFLRILGIRYEYVVDPDWYPQMEVHEYALDVLCRHPADMLGWFHYCWPHYPYIWNRQGRKPGRISADAAREHTVDNYMDNLAYTDRIIGEICQTLRQCGRWDDSVIVFTSDHNWRFDPDQPESRADLEDPDPTSEWKHVPLIIKYPGQTVGRIESDRPVTHGGLHRLLKAYAGGQPLSPDNDLLDMASP